VVDRSALGASGEWFEMDVERGKIREFAQATWSENPAYLTQESAVSEPTFLTTMIFWQDESSNPWGKVAMDQERGLHAEQEFTFFGPPPRAGTRLRARTRIAEIYDKEGKRGGTMTFVEMVTDFHDTDGVLVAQSKMTGVETSRPPDATT
jgi:hypothetical protein